jgi:hypothetical protein
VVEVDVTDRYRDAFEEMWPRAVDRLKTLAENSG